MFHIFLYLVFAYIRLVMWLAPGMWVGCCIWLIVDVMENRKTPERIFINKFL